MKRAWMGVGILVFVLAFPLVSFGAGTFMVGGKYWYTTWDSAVLDWFEKDIGAGFKAVGITLQSDVSRGKGYLAGPVLGYQTESGTWAFSLAGMAFSNFSQDWKGTAGTMDLNTRIDTTRRDFDLAVTYSLAQHQDKFSLLKYCRIYLGYKYQMVDYDLNLQYTTGMAVRNYDYKLDAQVHMPTVGLGVVIPIFSKLALGLQGGVGLALINLKMKDPDGVEFDIDPQYSFTFNTEANLNFMPVKNLIIQLGFRYQEWYLKARSPQRWEKTESKDVTFGPTFMIVLAF
jgi:hypothetical protein